MRQMRKRDKKENKFSLLLFWKETKGEGQKGREVNYLEIEIKSSPIQRLSLSFLFLSFYLSAFFSVSFFHFIFRTEKKRTFLCLRLEKKILILKIEVRDWVHFLKSNFLQKKFQKYNLKRNQEYKKIIDKDFPEKEIKKWKKRKRKCHFS